MQRLYLNLSYNVIAICLIFCVITNAAARDDISLFSNYRIAFDTSSRYSESLRDSNDSWAHFIGLDLHKVFSSADGDIGTLVFQPYLTRLSNVKNPPFFFDDGDDWELVWRIANFNYTGLSRGGFNLRVGHFEIPFGLEQNIDTNGTLRQYTFSDRAIKVDWGVTVNGKYLGIDYEVAMTRGSGNDFTSRHDPYLFSGRVASSAQQNFITGFSWMYGDVLTAGRAVPRARAGIDIAYYLGPWEFLFEMSGGNNDGLGTVNALLETSWRTPLENLHLYVQFRQVANETSADWADRSRVSWGGQYRFNRKLSASAEIALDLDPFDGNERAAIAKMQIRLRL